MKPIIAALLALMILVTINSTVLADPFAEVPAEHFLYDVLMDLVRDGIIVYPIEAAREVRLSRYEMALLLGKALEDLSLPIKEERQQLEQQLIAGYLQEDAESVPTLAEIFDELSAEELYKLQQAVYAAYDEAIGESQGELQHTHTGTLLKAAAELNNELTALGFSLTELEQLIVAYQPVINTRYQLRLFFEKEENPTKPVIQIAGNHQEYAVTLQQTSTQGLRTISQLDQPTKQSYQLSSKGRETAVGRPNFAAEDTFDLYRFINFTSLP